MINIYYTKNALKTGIELYKGCEEQNADHETNSRAGLHHYYWYDNLEHRSFFKKDDHCHFTLESALAHAEQMKKEHIAKLEHRIKRAKELNFPLKKRESVIYVIEKNRKLQRVHQEIGHLSEIVSKKA